ncbi:4-coumarate-CoA ligase 2 [Nannizzia gypsea CBS 118893]|uniref:4-coumarate-CoA ligase 2 n=1 Tax=Arthroderma gypseum (strain ATCC MYA-4604 / CBS 118893) TaxID=535722 RepID=E4UVA3_ARTGP|nr:4-coumarate-CoA ligase 2 [Nannizzia gypsea CBS 118893]EFR02230.1 4-coumarate-CoA ligase 2 [Nannizzia gypsea CBS 118893]
MSKVFEKYTTGPESPDVHSKYQPTDEVVFRSPFGPFPKVDPDLNLHDFFFPPENPIDQADHDLFIDGHTGTTVSLYQFYDSVVSLSRALRHDGPNPVGLRQSPVDDNGSGEIIGILSRNHLSWPLLVHACFRSELVFGSISPNSTPYELYHVMRKMQVTSMAVHESLLPLLMETVQSGPQAGNDSSLPFVFDARKIIVISDDLTLDTVQGYPTVQSLIRLGSKTPEKPWKRSGGNRLCYLLQSSGTSGFPKAMMISHRNAIHTTIQGMITATRTADFLNMQPQPSVVLGIIPAYHSYGLTMYSLRVNVMRSTNVLMSKWDLETALRLIEKHKVTTLPLVPPLVRQIALSPLTEKYDLSSVTFAASAAAYLPPDVAHALGKKLPQKAPVQSGYGLSEALSVAQPMAEGLFGISRSQPGTIGHLMPGIEAKLVDPDTLKPVPKGTKGELWVRAPVVTPGYFKDRKATASLFAEPGWLRTGDLMMRDAEDRLHFLDRLKEMIKVKGMQVAATEVEDTLLSHPDKLVRDACVAGVDNGRGDGGLFPRAWVVLSEEGRRRDPIQVMVQLDEFVKCRLSKYKHLAGGIEIVDQIPRTPSGKMLRREMRDRYHSQQRDRQDKARL